MESESDSRQWRRDSNSSIFSCPTPTLTPVLPVQQGCGVEGEISVAIEMHAFCTCMPYRIQGILQLGTNTVTFHEIRLQNRLTNNQKAEASGCNASSRKWPGEPIRMARSPSKRSQGSSCLCLPLRFSLLLGSFWDRAPKVDNSLTHSWAFPGRCLLPLEVLAHLDRETGFGSLSSCILKAITFPSIFPW